MDPVKITKYFAALQDELTAKGLTMKPSRIWNMDETGIQIDHKPRKVVVVKGAKYLQSNTSGNRELITVIATINAAGQCLLPHIIAKGKTAKALLSFQPKTAPAGTTWSKSDSGWTKQGIAKLRFTEIFLKILAMSGHSFLYSTATIHITLLS